MVKTLFWCGSGTCVQLVTAFRFLRCHAKRLERHFKSLKGQRIEQLELDLAYGDMVKASRAYYQVKDLCALRSISPYDANEYPEVCMRIQRARKN